MEKFIKNSLAIINTNPAINLMERELITIDGQLNLEHFTKDLHTFLERSLNPTDARNYQDIAINWNHLFFGFEHSATNLKTFKTQSGSQTIWLLKFLTDKAPISLMRELVRAYPSSSIALKTSTYLTKNGYFFQSITCPSPIQMDKYQIEGLTEEWLIANRFRKEHLLRSIEFIDFIEQTDPHLNIFN
jgi:hypothetical protein